MNALWLIVAFAVGFIIGMVITIWDAELNDKEARG